MSNLRENSNSSNKGPSTDARDVMWPGSAPALPVRSAARNMTMGFGAISLVSAVALAFVVGESWYAQESMQTHRLFKESLCKVPEFRSFVQFTLEQQNFNFVFQSTSTQWLDTKRVLQNAGTIACDESMWLAAEEILAASFPMRRMMVWINMNREPMSAHIGEFQLVERLYSWSSGCLMVGVANSVLGTAFLALSPPSTCVLQAQRGQFVICFLLLVIGIILFMQAHNHCLYGSSSFRDESMSDSASLFNFFLIPVALVAVFCGWGATFMSQKSYGVPSMLAWIPGAYSDYPDSSPETTGPPTSLRELTVEMDI